MKQCPRCKKIKPKIEFGSHKRYRDGLRSWCKSCEVESAMNTRKKHHAKILEWERRTRIYSNIGSKRILISNLNKRPFPENKICEICLKQAKKLSYHHWNNDNPSLGIWVCHACHGGCNFADKEFLAKYIRMKESIS